MKTTDFPEVKNFSLVLGGPFFQLLRKAHLSGDALELIKVRTITVSLMAWLPLFVLSLINGKAWGQSTNLPFIEDIEVHVRFLLAVPLLVVAELIVHERVQLVVKQFQERNLIPDNAIEKFNQAIHSAMRLRNSIAAEIFIVALIYVIGYNVVWKAMALETTTWYTEPAAGNGKLSLAGIWFRYFSLPLFQFLFLRWYYRIFIWIRFLIQVSRIKLRLIPTHPDHVGGLSFISNSVYALMPLAVVHGVIAAGTISNHIFHDRATLLDFKIELIVISLIAILIFILPLFAFSGQLAETKRSGSLKYGKLATQCANEFETKWIQDTMQAPSSLLGSNDPQSLADLQHIYSNLENMSVMPINKTDIIMLVVAVLAPVFPLVLTMMPFSDLIKMAAGMLF